MVFPDVKRAVLRNPAMRLHLVPKTGSGGERNLPQRDPRVEAGSGQIDSQGRIAPAIPAENDKVMFIDRLQKAIHPDQAQAYPGQSIPASGGKPLCPAELHQLYAGTSVPAHRYLAGLLSAEMNLPAKWLAGYPEVGFSDVLAAWMSTNSSTEYEQLNSLGLDARTSRLTGMVQIKRRGGYLGGPLTAGSREFVAFWVDWGSGFRYEGTTSVAVHDFSSLPATGLEYKVFLPVNIRSCALFGSKEAKKMKVRAVLSWNTPPSTSDPCARVVWGNSLDGMILIPPGINASIDARYSMKQAPAGFCLRAMS